MTTGSLQIAEIFSSIHGEVNGHHQGRMVTFIRLSGCNLSCFYCDTAHTQDSNYGVCLTIDEILTSIRLKGNNYICITGGEPLLQDISVLLEHLYYEGYHISVETNGTIDITPYFRYVESFVIDYKCPSTSNNLNMNLSNYKVLREKDVIKFVISNETDVKHAKTILEMINKVKIKAVIAFSPVALSDTSYVPVKDLYDLIRKHEIKDAVLSVQIHKLIGFS